MKVEIKLNIKSQSSQTGTCSLLADILFISASTCGLHGYSCPHQAVISEPVQSCQRKPCAPLSHQQLRQQQYLNLREWEQSIHVYKLRYTQVHDVISCVEQVPGGLLSQPVLHFTQTEVNNLRPAPPGN